MRKLVSVCVYVWCGGLGSFLFHFIELLSFFGGVVGWGDDIVRYAMSLFGVHG